MAGAIAASEAKRRIHGAGELAFLDIRPVEYHVAGHPLLAAPCPAESLEGDIGRLVPRRTCPVLLVDGGDGAAVQAAGALAALGYEDVSWIERGADGWVDAGYTLFEGVNVPSKTLGELLEAEWRVPCIDAGTLAGWQSEARAFHLFDGRPAHDYARTTIPGARSAPNGELAHRAVAYMPDDVPVIVNCAGRTRSIVGAASLALAGVRQPVYALENGTRGWMLSGRALSRGACPEALPRPDAGLLQASRDRAEALICRRGLSSIGPSDAERWQAEPHRTTYLFDVRSEEEFERGTLAGAIHAPLVQLVQATDGWIGVRRARLVLADDTGLRAAIAAVFLAAMNFDVHLLSGAAMSAAPTPPVRHAALPVPPQDDGADAARRYLAWERGLVGQLDAQERAEYRIGPSPF